MKESEWKTRSLVYALVVGMSATLPWPMAVLQATAGLFCLVKVTVRYLKNPES